MKGPHFFEKRKKEMARQEKLKQKAERKAQRKAEKDKGEGGEGGESGDEGDEFGDIETVNATLQGEGQVGSDQVEEEQVSQDGQPQGEHGAAVNDSDGQIRGT